MALAACVAATVATAAAAEQVPIEPVARFLVSWQQAWERQDAEPYFDHYAADCLVDGRNRAAFEAHKRNLFARGGSLSIALGDLRVEAIRISGDPFVRATVDQEYASARLSDFGRKELVLRAQGDRFLIVRESWTAGAGRIERPIGEDARPAEGAGVAAAAGAPAADAGATTEPPLLGGGYVPPAEASAPVTPETVADDDVLRMDPLLGPSIHVPQFDYGLPSDTGDRRVVEEIVATVNGQILTRTMLIQRIGWYEATLVEENPPDLDDQLRHLAASALDATIKRWLILQEARSRSADIEGFWRQWLGQFRQQVGAENMAELEKLLAEQGTSLAELREQVVETEIPSVFLQQQIAEEITFTEDELEAWFTAHHADYERSREVTLRQILIPVAAGESSVRALAVAEAAIGTLREGKDWCEVSEVYGAGAPGCGDIGTLKVSDLLPELRETAAGLPVGAISRPVASTQGIHVLQVTARSGFEPVRFEEVRDAVLRDARAAEYDERSAEYVRDLRARAEIDINDRYPHDDPAAASATTGVSQ